MKFPAILCFAFAFVAGCAIPQYNYRPLAHQVSRPPIGAVCTANVGDELLRQGFYTERDAIKLTKAIRIGLLGYYTLTPGYYIKTGEDKESCYYRPAEGPDGGMVKKAALSDPWESVRLTNDLKKISVVTIFHAKVSEPADGVEKTKYLQLGDRSYQQTLIYSGKAGNIIKIGYREFSNDMARPAFNNDVDYDLSSSHVIGYKGARLEVLEATNELIKYRVISNFTNPVR